LNNFSKKYDAAIEGLKNENYIFHNSEDNVFVFSEINRKYIKPLLIQKKTEVRIKCFYIAEFENGCKIGMSTNLKARALEYCKPWSRPLLSLKVLQCENPENVESHLKKCFKKYAKSRSTEFLYIDINKIEREALAFDPFATFESYEYERYLPRI